MLLGKKAPKFDARTLHLAKYLTAALPPSPPAKSWIRASKMQRWPMMLNDRLGDCVIASKGHLIQLDTALVVPHRVATLTDRQVLAGYEAVGGYVPGDPATDQGCVMLDALNYWRRTGYGGHKLAAFAAVRPLDTGHVRASINLFGAAEIGLGLPLTARQQVGDVWDVVGDGKTGDSAPGSWGGHCVPVPDYDADELVCITWGAVQRMTQRFFNAYCDEAYAPLPPDWLAANRAPNGFDLAALLTDLSLVTG